MDHKFQTSISKKFLLLAVTVVITLLMLEIGVRMVVNSQRVESKRDRHIGWKYASNIDIPIAAEDGNGTVRFRTNKDGFVGPNVDVEKDQDLFRIVNLGDSFTAALAVPYEENYVHILGTLLSPHQITESLNFGVGGQGTGEALDTYRQYASRYNPDHVILWFFLGNDYEDNLVYKEGGVDFQGKSSDGWSRVKTLAKKSELVHLTLNRATRIPLVANFLRGRVLNRVGHDLDGSDHVLPLTVRLMFTPDDENSVAIEKTRNLLTEMRDVLAASGTPLSVVMIPAHFQVDPNMTSALFEQYPILNDIDFDVDRPNRILRDIVDELGVNHFDLTNIFKEECLNECPLYVCDNCHLSSEGHLLAAQAVANSDFFPKPEEIESISE